MNRYLILGASAAMLVCAPGYAADAAALDAEFFASLFVRIAVACAGLLLMATLLQDNSRCEEAASKTHRELNEIARDDRAFDWNHIESRVEQCFGRVHEAWGKADMSLAKDAMTSWYWQNQQLNFVNEWDRLGVRNICHVDSINSITPIMLQRGEDGSADEASLVVRVDALMLDYLVHTESETVLAGSEDFRDIETVWTLTRRDGEWKVCEIEDGSVVEQYATACCETPDVVQESEAFNENQLRA